MTNKTLFLMLAVLCLGMYAVVRVTKMDGQKLGKINTGHAFPIGYYGLRVTNTMTGYTDSVGNK